jgi:2-amino-4-hydroxy-6-hydroxymethyldihydropteridine diphosphokinase
VSGRRPGLSVTRAYLSLGSNLGDRAAHLARAVQALADAGARSLEGGLPALTVAQLSPLYETEPLGPSGEVLADQPPFLNYAVAVDTWLTASELRWLTAGVETALGRRTLERWLPRTVDIDLVLFGDERIERPHLVVPHPRLAERAFVVRPLLDLDPSLAVPGVGPLADVMPGLEGQGVAPFESAGAFRTRAGI